MQETSSSPARSQGESQKHSDVPKLFLPFSFDNNRECPRESHRPTPTILRPRLVANYHVQCERIPSLYDPKTHRKLPIGGSQLT